MWLVGTHILMETVFSLILHCPEWLCLLSRSFEKYSLEEMMENWKKSVFVGTKH